ncbi:hypothetical protein Shyhy01_47060 [Streptomyces hygroscopicus subsp. hygroscopicus]|nr:hypothetical protein Shyhy01_47060 [Streptomyces hygroscopicus subsp. hygroscopicus]
MSDTWVAFDSEAAEAHGCPVGTFPTEPLPDVKRHLDACAKPGRDGYVFLGPVGGRLRRTRFRDDWINARKSGGRRWYKSTLQPLERVP